MVSANIFRNIKKISQMNFDNNERYDHVIVYALVLVSALPNTACGFVLRLFVLCMCLFFFYSDQRINRLCDRMLALCVLMIFSILITITFGFIHYSVLNLSLIKHESIRMFFNIVTILIASNVRTSHRTMYKAVCILFAYVFAIEIAQWRIPLVANKFIKMIYVNEGQEAKYLILATIKKYGINGFRAGSIYINPNICGGVLICCVIVFIMEYYFTHSRYIFFAIGLALFGIVLTGSRTAILLFVIIIVVCILYKPEYAEIKKLIWGGVVSTVALVWLIGAGNGFASRSLNFDILNNSFFDKSKVLIDYIYDASFSELFFGGMANPIYYQVDAEWGYIITYFGVIGLVWYILLVTAVAKSREHDGKTRWICPLYLIVSALTMTVLLNFQISVLFLVISLANYVDLPHVKNQYLECELGEKG